MGRFVGEDLPAEVPRFTRHAFVCVNAEACAPLGAEAVHKAMKDELRAAGLKESLRVNKAGCLGQCGHGPIVVVYPEGTWYSHVTPNEGVRIWREHMIGGRPVDDLLFRTEAAGTNVLGKQPDGSFRPVGGPHSSRCSRCPDLTSP
ncbi:MAG: (2Fe-2S) ferredoxin domain-containing protein [Thermoplasmatota archaeon]